MILCSGIGDGFMVCKKCGKENNEGFLFCTECGSKLEESNEVKSNLNVITNMQSGNNNGNSNALTNKSSNSVNERATQ